MNVNVMTHPLIQHKVTLIRSIDTGTKDFRQLLEEIAFAASRALVAFLAISKFVVAGSGFNNRITIPIIRTTIPTGNNIFLLI